MKLRYFSQWKVWSLITSSRWKHKYYPRARIGHLTKEVFKVWKTDNGTVKIHFHKDTKLLKDTFRKYLDSFTILTEYDVTLLIMWSLSVMEKHSTPLRTLLIYLFHLYSISINPFLEYRNFNGFSSVTLVSAGAKQCFSFFLDSFDFTEN